MYQPRPKAATALLILILVSLLTACNPPAAEQPTSTMDPNMIYTAAAQTVQAQFTQNAALTPSATATLESTATLTVPTFDTTLPTLPAVGSITQQATLAPGGLPPIVTLTPLTNAQPTLPAANTRITAQWVKNDPPDGTIILAGTKFDIAWTIKNTGTTTWNTNYTYGYLSGAKYFEKLNYNFRKEVKPGEEVTILVDATAPSTSGSYYTWWKIKDDTGQNIGDVDLTITVVKANETPKTTQTATTTP
jgi:hypothetical protein